MFGLRPRRVHRKGHSVFPLRNRGSFRVGVSARARARVRARVRVRVRFGLGVRLRVNQS